MYYFLCRVLSTRFPGVFDVFVVFRHRSLYWYHLHQLSHGCCVPGTPSISQGTLATFGSRREFEAERSMYYQVPHAIFENTLNGIFMRTKVRSDEL